MNINCTNFNCAKGRCTITQIPFHFFQQMEDCFAVPPAMLCKTGAALFYVRPTLRRCRRAVDTASLKRSRVTEMRRGQSQLTPALRQRVSEMRSPDEAAWLGLAGYRMLRIRRANESEQDVSLLLA